MWIVVAVVAAYEVYDLWGNFDTKFWIFVDSWRWLSLCFSSEGSNARNMKSAKTNH